MNTYLKTIILSLFLLFLCPERCFAAEPEVFAGCQAKWADEENGIAKIILTQSDTSATEFMNKKSDYIFMVDGSRTTVLNDSHLFQEENSESEPLESHCPCMTESHYYMVGGQKVLPLTYTLGYECDTGELRTWSAERKLWSDSAGAHFNGTGKKIPVRYANGCLDIFTIFKNTVVESVRDIAKRKDGSRVAFIVYSGKADALYGVLDYTEDYEGAVRKIQKAGFEPGSLICPGIDRARALYGNGGKNQTTKLLIMGDGRNSDIVSGMKKTEEFRILPGTAVYTACMGKEACVMGSGYQAMSAMSGNRQDRFWRIQTKPQKEMSKAFAAVMNEKMPVPVSADEKKYSGTIAGEWEYYEDTAKGYAAECTEGRFSCVQNNVTWQIPKDRKGTMYCSFYVKLRENARYIAARKEYEVLKPAALSYIIRGGSNDGKTEKIETACNTLIWKPSKIEVTKVKLLSGISCKKEEDVWYVKGGSENEISFVSYTKYATQEWKPEQNIFYEKASSGMQAKYYPKMNVRSGDLSHLTSNYRTTLYDDGAVYKYYPSASIGQGANQIFTEKFDETKKLTLICDAVPPDINGTVPEIIRDDTKLVFSAEDNGSGVKKGGFSLEVRNPKTGEKKVFEASGKNISWNIRLDDLFYSGNLNWTLKAEDNVGNSVSLSGVSNIRHPKGEEEISNEIRTRILQPRSDFSVDGIY